MNIEQLRNNYPWPEEKPNVPQDPHGWFSDEVKTTALKNQIDSSTGIIVELGSWLGMSTRLMLEAAPNAAVISIDHWQGSIEHKDNPKIMEKLPTLYETFLVNCWEYRERLIPIRSSSNDGLKVVYDSGIRPDLILIDADHTYEGVLFDLVLSDLLFPTSLLVGDDYGWTPIKKKRKKKKELFSTRLKNNLLGQKEAEELPYLPVRDAVNYFAKQKKYSVENHGNLWIIRK